jgi:hypothetical protein
MRRLVGLIACLIMMGISGPGTGAQDATPKAELVTPDPAECRVEPRSVENMTSFLATPAAAAASPASAAATPDADPVPEGEPADATTVAGITATADELYACYNANAFLRVFALFTDEYMARSFVEEGITAEAVRLLATPIDPEPAKNWMSVAVQDVRIRPDGRIGALLVSRSPLGGDGTTTSYYVFVERDGRYLIDDVVINIEAGR